MLIIVFGLMGGGPTKPPPQHQVRGGPERDVVGGRFRLRCTSLGIGRRHDSTPRAKQHAWRHCCKPFPCRTRPGWKSDGPGELIKKTMVFLLDCFVKRPKPPLQHMARLWARKRCCSWKFRSRCNSLHLGPAAQEPAEKKDARRHNRKLSILTKQGESGQAETDVEHASSFSSNWPTPYPRHALPAFPAPRRPASSNATWSLHAATHGRATHSAYPRIYADLGADCSNT